MAHILILASISKAFRNFSFELLEAMRHEGMEVTISIPDDPVNADFESIGCRVIPSPLNRHGMNPLSEVKLMMEYRHLCRTLKPDVILTYTIKPNTYGGMTAAGFHIPCIATITGLGTVFFNQNWKYRLIRKMLKYGLSKDSCMIFQNEHNRDILQKSGFIHCPTRMVAGSGVNLEKHSLLPYPETAEGKIRFLMAARAQKEKGVAEFLETAKKIRGKYPQSEFHFAGLSEEPVYADMIAKAHETGLIINHGFLKFPEMRSLMKNIHAVILPTYHEGMSNVLLESAAAGRPVLATDIPGCRETMTDGVSGFLYPSMSAEALTDAVDRFILLQPEEKSKMGLAGRRHVEQNFDRKKVVAAYMEEIGKLLQTGSHSR